MRNLVIFWDEFSTRKHGQANGCIIPIIRKSLMICPQRKREKRKMRFLHRFKSNFHKKETPKHYRKLRLGI